MEELVRQLKHAEGQAEAALDEVHAITQRAVAAERATIDAGHERAGEIFHAHEASARAEEAENRAWKAGAQAREAEAKANKAVANYKSSSEFEQEVIEANLDAYAKGFDLCKAKVSAAFNISSSDLEGIHPEDLGGEEPAQEEEAGEESGPSRPRTCVFIFFSFSL